jgi:hypothetical protein
LIQRFKNSKIRLLDKTLYRIVSSKGFDDPNGNPFRPPKGFDDPNGNPFRLPKGFDDPNGKPARTFRAA